MGVRDGERPRTSLLGDGRSGPLLRAQTACGAYVRGDAGGSWNLERGGRTGSRWAKQSNVIVGMRCDVAVLTEPPPALAALEGRVVSSPGRRKGLNGLESWVAVIGFGVVPAAIDLPFERMAAAAVLTISGDLVVVYGSVLPWNAAATQAPDLALPGESSAAMFDRVLAAQEADVTRLQAAYPGVVVLWVGDFNQTLCGANFGGSAQKRHALESSLQRLGMVAWNAKARHARDGMCAVDLVCGPKELVVGDVTYVDPAASGEVLSDHAGYVVEVPSLPSPARPEGRV